MSDARRKRELGRGERVLPGVYRLRLPLPWPGVPHCNAWALSAGDGFVLVDTGVHDEHSMEHLERALQMCGLRLEDTRLVVCTHAHSDHCGQAVPIAERAGCELWMHPSHELMNRLVEDPEAVLARRKLVLDPKCVPVQPRPYRAFQGWRYLAPKDAPPDLDRAAPGARNMPEHLRRELRELGLL